MAKKLNINIKRWAAWAPGVDTIEDWQQWVIGAIKIGATAIPPKPAIPPMLRRRLGLSGKIALHCALQCLDKEQRLPTIFCSRHGELQRTQQMLDNLANHETLSPTAFSLSVHNANSGLFSIARKDHSPCTALSAGEDSIMMGLIEAAGLLLSKNHPEVLVIASDEPLPPRLAAFQEPFIHPYGAAFLISSSEGETFSFLQQNQAAHYNPELPQALELVKQILHKTRTFTLNSNNFSWQWQYYGS